VSCLNMELSLSVAIAKLSGCRRNVRKSGRSGKDGGVVKERARKLITAYPDTEAVRRRGSRSRGTIINREVLEKARRG